MSEPLLIVSSLAEDDGIYVFRIADADGRLELVRQNNVAKQPFYFDVHPRGDLLYAIHDPGEERLVSAMHFDRDSGTLELINQQSCVLLSCGDPFRIFEYGSGFSERLEHQRIPRNQDFVVDSGCDAF